MNSQIPIPPSVFFEVPNGLLDVEGNDASRLLFSYLGPVRYQQVYDASQFSKVPTGGAFVSRIHFRADCASRRSWWMPDLQVRLSTTPKAPDQLSANFADNVGVDEIVVWGPARYAPPAIPAGCPSDFFTANEINLSVPFFYDPAKGNLLLELSQSGIDWTGGPLSESLLDAQNALGDSVSRAAAFSLTTNTAEVVDTTGLVTGFQFDPTPSLGVQYETNAVVLSWPYFPLGFQLQQASTLQGGAAWENYAGTNQIVGFYRYVQLPREGLAPRRFYRLFLETLQPLPSPPATPVVQVGSRVNP